MVGNGGRRLRGRFHFSLVVVDATVEEIESNGEVRLGGDLRVLAAAGTGVAFLPGARQAVTGSNDKTLRLWNVRR
jgi:hypothetical protein